MKRHVVISLQERKRREGGGGMLQRFSWDER